MTALRGLRAPAAGCCAYGLNNATVAHCGAHDRGKAAFPERREGT